MVNGLTMLLLNICTALVKDKSQIGLCPTNRTDTHTHTHSKCTHEICSTSALYIFSSLHSPDSQLVRITTSQSESNIDGLKVSPAKMAVTYRAKLWSAHSVCESLWPRLTNLFFLRSRHFYMRKIENHAFIIHDIIHHASHVTKAASVFVTCVSPFRVRDTHTVG